MKILDDEAPHVKQNKGGSSMERLTERMAEWKYKRPLRRDVKEVKENESKKAESGADSRSWVRIRLFPIWLRIIIVLAIIIVAMVLGVMVGYGVIGDGQPADALKWRTWQHIIDIMSGQK
jgi:hypothetical protein